MYKNFSFYVPRVVFGVGESRKLSVYVKKLGASKALVLYDPGVKGAGVVDPIIAALNADGIPTVEFGDIEADPSMNTVDKCAQFGKDNGVDILIAVGGGSTIDTGKTARMLITNEGKAAEYSVDRGVDLFEKQGLPYIVVPTTSGTGSELTFSSVLTDFDKGRKVAVRDFMKMPVSYAVLDPETVLTVPPAITAACGMDALTHCAEAYLKPTATPFGDSLNLDAVKLCINNIETATNDGSNIEARANMMLASTMAGAGMASSGLHVGHGIAQGIGALLHVSHGVSCAWALPYMFEHVLADMPEKAKNLAAAMNIKLSGDETPEEVKDLIVKATFDLIDRLPIPTPKEKGFTEEENLEPVVAQIIGKEQKLCQQSIKPFTEDDCRRYIRHLLNR